jgi:hypothetical protein
MYLGWNTMDAEQYRKLKQYVTGGGTLFMAVPHLSTDIRRPPSLCNSANMKLFRNGRVEDLFGVRVKGMGDYFTRINAIDVIQPGLVGLPERRFIQETALFPAIAKVTRGRVIARSHDKRPLLIENRLGRGAAYLLCSWDYPGLNTYQEFMRVLVERFAEYSVGDIRVRSRDPVEWGVFRGDFCDTVFALNTHLENPAIASVEAPRGISLRLQIDPGCMRLVYVSRDLALAFDDPMTAVKSAKQEDTGEFVVEGSQPVGLTLALADGLAPKEVSFGGEVVADYGFEYPYYSFHFKAASGTLRIRARRTRKS